MQQPEISIHPLIGRLRCIGHFAVTIYHIIDFPFFRKNYRWASNGINSIKCNFNIIGFRSFNFSSKKPKT